MSQKISFEGKSLRYLNETGSQFLARTNEFIQSGNYDMALHYSALYEEVQTEIKKSICLQLEELKKVDDELMKEVWN